MPFEISDLWEWDGRIGRKTYFVAGFFGCAIKFNLDRLIAIYFFHRSINFVDYWRPLGAAAALKNFAGRYGMAWRARGHGFAIHLCWPDHDGAKAAGS
jgi:hypothetical protein